MTQQDDHVAHHDDHEEHGSASLYISVFLALCCLTTLSFLTYFDFWREVIPVGVSRLFMMGVSCTKALLVIMFFMHLKWEANWKWVLTVPASMMSIFLMLMLVPDIGFRMDHASYDRMIYASEIPVEEETTHEQGDHDAESHEAGDHDAGDHDTGDQEEHAEEQEATEHSST